MIRRTLAYVLLASFAVLSVGLAIPRILLKLDSDPSPRRFQEGGGSITHSANMDNILLITIDTLRADHLGIYGYARPTSTRIDSWFGNSQIYERAYSTEANTTPSVVSMLTGLIPQRHGVRLLFQKISGRILTVPDYLAHAGYQTSAVVSNFVLTAEASGLDTRFGHYNDLVDEQESYRLAFERRASRTTDAAVEWLVKGRDPGQPHFLWVHYIDPHGPYQPSVDGLTNFTHSEIRLIDKDKIPDYQQEPGLLDGNEYVDRYDEEIAYVDREVGRLLDVYERLGLAKDATVVLTADHGESMMEHEQWFSHGYQVYEYIVRVPLMIRSPRFPARRIVTPVSLVDLAPTLLKVAGASIPQGLDGRALPPSSLPRDVFVEATMGENQWRALIRGKEKWLIGVKRNSNFVDRALHRLFLVQPFVEVVEFEQRYYHLDEDPGELRPLHWPREEDALSLIRMAAEDPDPAGLPTRLTPGIWVKAPKVAPGVDARSLEKLKALGYVQ